MFGPLLGPFESQFEFHNKLWKILKEMEIPDHLTCLLRNLYTGQEAIVRIGHGTTDWFPVGKGICQGRMLAEAQAGIKISRRNINNLKYADDTTL